MKTSLKTLATWLIIGIILIILISSIMDNSNSRITYSELIYGLQNEQVEKIEIEANKTKAYVTFKNDKTQKQVIIPSIDTFMDKINDHLTNKSVALEEKSESLVVTILSLLSPFGLLLIFLIFWFLFMNNAQGRKQNNVIW